MKHTTKKGPQDFTVTGPTHTVMNSGGIYKAENSPFFDNANYGKAWFTRKDHAQLFAAAPDLLAALKAARGIMKLHKLATDILDAAILRAEAK